MLNADGIRELAYITKIDAIEPIVGSDNCEAAVVGGWRVMVRKGTFQPGDLAVYFEIDSKVPETETYAFLEKKHYRVKSQKYTFGGKGNFISQGLLMAFSDFNKDTSNWTEGTFLTKELGVTYAVDDDNKRKAPSADKYKKMAGRHPKLFRNPIIKSIYKTNIGKKILFFFLGRRSDKKNNWPSWVVKTDEERIQNLVHMIPDFAKEEWVATEKVDGTSTTFTMKGFGRKREYFICSRNVVFDKPDKKCYYETNVYTEMAEKYHMEKVLADILDSMSSTCQFVTIQGETYGASIQKRDYSIKDHDLCVFNLILGYKNGTVKRFNPYEMKALMDKYDIPTVPIIGTISNLPESCDEILAMAGGNSAIDGLPREGLVFRTLDGVRSFKAVDNNFLLTYHN